MGPRAAAGAGQPELPLPVSIGGRIAVGGLALLTGWIALSANWTTLEGAAQDDTVRSLAYLGALLAGAAAWRDDRAARALEPALAAGALIVIGYGLAGRVLPEIVELSASKSGSGRLEQPLTYWNATGVLAAMGLVLCVRLMGDAGRAVALRVAAAVAVAPLAAGLYLTLSRGAVAAMLIGFAVLILLAPKAGQLRAVAIALVTALVAGGIASIWPEVESLVGSSSERSGEGLLALALLCVIALVVAGAQLLACRAGEGAGEEPSLRRGSCRFSRLSPCCSSRSR